MRKLIGSSAVALVVLAVTLTTAALRNAENGAVEMRASDRAFEAGQVQLALLHAERAAALYVPRAEHVGHAYERIRTVARAAERARDRGLALAAWRSMRAAALETRHLWAPRGAELAEAELELARLTGADASQGELGLAPRPPSPFAALTAALGFIAANVGLVSFAGRARLGAPRRWAPRWWSAGLLVAAGSAALILGLIRA